MLKKIRAGRTRNRFLLIFAQLLVPLIYYNKVAWVGRNWYKKSLKTFNKHWGFTVTSFFYTYHKSKKILYQLIYLASGFFYYFDAWWLINAHVIKKILLGCSTHLTRYKTRINNWLDLEINSNPDVSFLSLAIANVYYGLFKELFKEFFPPLLYSFSGPYYYGL